MRRGFEDEVTFVTDSFEKHCFQMAWYLLRHEKLHRSEIVDFYARPGTLESALKAAGTIGLSIEPFSDERHKYLSAEGRTAMILRRDELWRIHAGARDSAATTELAIRIAEGSGAILPRKSSS